MTVSGRTYLSENGANELRRLIFSNRLSVIRSKPEVLIEDVDKWLAITRGMIDSLMVVAEVMETTKNSVHELMVTELEKELCL